MDANSHFQRIFIWFLLSSLVLYSCNIIDVNSPSLNTDQEDVYISDAKAIAVLNGIYSSMCVEGLAYGSTISGFMNYYPGLSADEFTYHSGSSNVDQILYYENNLSANTITPNIWASLYRQIFIINSAIEGISGSTQLSEKVKQQLLGEAKFLRAFNYFYLVNLYGEVPLALSTNYKENIQLSRSNVERVYDQIEIDLKDAESKLDNENFISTDRINDGTERIYPSKWAVKAFLARIYLYRNDYTNAVNYATEVINNQTLFNLTNLESVFLKNSNEAIWQLQPVNLGWNTEEGRFFVLPENGPNDEHPVYLNSHLLNSFEKDDWRRIEWVDSVVVDGLVYNFPYKYKNATYDDPVTEYEMVLRLGEVYLIRSEANAQLNNIGASLDDLKEIRNRAGLSEYKGSQSKEAVLAAIYHEREVELFCEWGHRWLDLKRSGTVDAVMAKISPEKGGIWNTYDKLYPVNNSELTGSPNIIQTEGY